MQMWKIHGGNPRLPHWSIRENTVKFGWQKLRELKGNDEDPTVRIDTYIQLKGLE